MNKIISIIITLIFSITLSGQEVASFLWQVAEHNPDLIAYKKLLEARKFQARTDLAPPDPVISFGYMPEKTTRTAVKKTWSVTQSFSFPVRYITQNQLSKGRIILAEHEFNLIKLNTLLNSKLLLFDLIYNRKKLDQLNSRKKIYDRLKSGWGKMLQAGEATILDYNKLVLEFSELTLMISRTETEISILTDKLKYMSGNKYDLPLLFDYPTVIDHDFEYIINEKINFHPLFLLPETEYKISLNEAKLSRSGILPEFHAGYASEVVEGEKFTGPVAGLTIPIWSNSNKIKTAYAMADHFSASRDAKLLELKTQVQSEYYNMKALGKNISAIRELISLNNNTEHLDLALASGEISMTEYFLYLGSSFQAEDRLSELEYEYNKSLAVLYDYELLRQPVN